MADRTTVVRLRCEPSEAKRWQRAAKARGITLSALVREALSWRLSPDGESDVRAQVAAMARRVG